VSAQDDYDKLTELLKIYENCDPGTDEEKKAWSNYCKLLDKLNLGVDSEAEKA